VLENLSKGTVRAFGVLINYESTHDGPDLW